MGQQISQETSQYQTKEWQVVYENPEHPLYAINSYFQRCLYNQLKNEYVEEYVLQFASEKDYFAYIQELKFRKEGLQCNVKDQKNCSQIQTFTSAYIYPVKQFVDLKKPTLCCSSYKGLLYIERVDLRLKDINEIPSSDQLYLLGSALEGFEYLYQKVGFFDICEEMIFITAQGKVRVWLNPNLSKMEPFINRKILIGKQNHQIIGSQSQMVANLVNIIESNTLHNNDKIVHFKQYLTNKGIFTKLSFYRALQELQFYCCENRLFVGDHLNCVYEMHQSIHIDGCQQEQSIVFTEKSKQQSLVKNAVILVNKRSSSQYSKSNLSVSSKRSVKCSRFAKERSKKVKKQSTIVNNQVSLQKKQYVIKEGQFSSHKKHEHNKIGTQNQKQEKPKKVYTFSEDDQVNTQLSTYNNDHLKIAKQTYQTKQTLLNPNIKEIKIIKFSYCKVPSHITSTKLKQYGNLNTLNKFNTLHSHSQNSYSLKQDVLSTKVRQCKKKISYHSPQESFTLDRELAQDLEDMLGYKMDDSQ